MIQRHICQVRMCVPGAFTCAEESTSQLRVTHSKEEGGLGFTFKWNMGWMNDTLAFFKLPAAERGARLDMLTFTMTYEFTEAFINAISHDEVTQLKGSLLQKFPGTLRARFSDLRLLLAYQWTRPGASSTKHLPSIYQASTKHLPIITYQ